MGDRHVAVIVLAEAPDIWVAGACVLAALGMLQFGNLLWNPLMQELVPEELIGRASSSHGRARSA